MKEKKEKPEKKKKNSIPESELPLSVLKKQKAKKRRVRFFISFLILLVLAFFAFWMGWIQADLKKDQIAIITNKIKKSKTLYDPDTFYWELSALIPGNVRIDIYVNAPHTLKMQRSGTLPSGHFYSRYLHPEENDHFDYSIDLDIAYKIKPDRMIELATQNEIQAVGKSEKIDFNHSHPDSIKKSKKEKNQKLRKTKKQPKEALSISAETENKKLLSEKDSTEEATIEQEDKLIEKIPLTSNQNYWERFEAQIQSTLYSYLSKRSSENEFVTRLGLDKSEIEKELSLVIEKINPDIELISLVVHQIQIPDYELYQKIKNLVQKDFTPTSNLSSIQKEILETEKAYNHNRNKIEALTELGKVLTEYPLLMDYLKIYATTDKDLNLLQIPQ